MRAASSFGFVVPTAFVALVVAWAAVGLVLLRPARPSRRSTTTKTKTPPAVAQATRPPPLRLTTAGRIAALAAVVLIPVVALAVLNSSSGFVWDDIKNLRQAQVEALSISYLLEPTSGHFAPGHRLGDWVLQRAFGFEFAPAQALLLLGFAVSLVLFHRILTELFRPGLWPLVFTLAYGVSMVHVGVTQWWASGLDRVPATILSFLSVLTYLRWYRTRSWPNLAVSVLSLPLGLLFYIKPAFVPVYLVLIRLLLLEPEQPLRQSVVATVREWRVWLLYAVTTGALAIVYVSRYPTESNQNGGVGVALRYLVTLWSQVLVPNLFGIFVPKANVSGLLWLAALAAHVVLLALVAWSLVRSASAWRAWAFFVITFLLNTVVVGLTRVGSFSPKVMAYTTYFNLEAVFLLFLALGAAFVGAGSVERLRQAAPAPGARAALGAGVAVYVALSFWGGHRISEPENWIGARSRVILDRTERDLARLRQSATPVALVDGVVHADVMPYLLVPYNNTSEVVPLLEAGVTFDPTAGDLFDVTPNGTVRPVTFAPESGGAAAELLRGGRFGVVGATPQFLEGNRVCIVADEEPVTIGLKPPLPLSGDGLAVRVEFGARAPSVISVVVDPLPVASGEGLARPQTKFRVVNVEAGDRQHRIFALDAPRVDAGLLVLAPHSELCLYRLELGRVLPR